MDQTLPLGFPLLYADAALLVVAKPAGLHAVPPKPPLAPESVETRLRAAYPETLLVHRLDRDTSGVMVFARSRAAQRHLGLQFERRILRKTYLARVAGAPPGAAGRVDLPLAADWPNRPRQRVCHERGRAAVTDWRLLAREPGGAVLLELRPLTGRSHQIRVHMAAIGCPILGDPLYAPPEARVAAAGLQLHAWRLELRHPDGGAWTGFEAPSPF